MSSESQAILRRETLNYHPRSPVETRLAASPAVSEQTETSRGDWILSRHALFKSDRHVAPDLDGQNHGGGQQQRSHGDVNHGRDHHGQFGLRRVSSPHDAGDEGEK